jgi:hypothetical protein
MKGKSNMSTEQLVSYIAHAAPATRRPSTGQEPYLRPEVGFTPRWHNNGADVKFGEKWHTDPEYRRESIVAMARNIKRRFGNRGAIGCLQDADQPQDLLTGAYGALFIPAIFGVPIGFQELDWPWSINGEFLTDVRADFLRPPDLENNPYWQQLMTQLDWIEGVNGKIVGFMNWQGVLNNSYRLRGEELFSDLICEPNRARHIFECVTQTMIEGIKRLYKRQKCSGIELSHVTISNCLVNLISSEQYAELILPFDQRISEAFDVIGIHNCAWKADPYMSKYTKLRNVGYIDMGLDSNLEEARTVFGKARRGLMYTPMDVRDKTTEMIEKDLYQIARNYGPCDIVFADIDIGVTDQRVLEIIDLCEKISTEYALKRHNKEVLCNV